MKILIVDDEPGSRSVLKHIVEHYGHEAVEAKDGQEGLEMASQYKPDAIISDALMLKMDGFEFLRAVRQDETLYAIPFVFYTAIYTGDKEYELALSLGADALIVKPKTPADFWKEFTSALEKHKSGRKKASRAKLIKKDEEYLNNYSRIVAAKLEKKVKELESLQKDIVNSSKEWRNTFDTMKDAICVLDRDGKILRCNKSMANLLAKPFDEILGNQCWEVIHNSYSPIEGCPCMTVKKTLKRESVVLPVDNKWFEVTVDPFLDSSGEFAGAVYIMADVTERKQLEDALRVAVVRAEDEKARIDSIIGAIGDGITIQDRDFRILYQNQAVKNLVGDHIGEFCYKAYEKREQRCEGCGVAQVFKDGETHIVERSAPTDKGTLHVEITASPLRDSKGNIVAGIEVVHNITERKRAEEALHLKTYMLSEAQRIAHIGSWETDFSTGKITWSDEMYRIYGVSPDTFEHKVEAFLKLIHPDDRAAIQRWIEATFSGKKELGLDFRIIWPDGTVRFIRGQGEAFFDETGKPVRAIGTAQDITERKHFEEALKTSEEKYRDLFENANDAIFILDADLCYLDVNNKAVELTGYSKDELLNLCFFDMIPNEQIPRSEAEFNELKTIGSYEKFGGRLRRKDGSFIDIEVSSSAIIKEGKVLGSRDIVRDITERKRAEDDIKSLNDLLTAINRIQQQFILEADPSVIFDNFLNNILSLTQSEYGFVGEVLYNAEGRPYLRTHAITNIAWNEETTAFYNTYAPNLEFFNLNTLFGEVMVTGRPVISNSPSSDPRRGGLPQGHPPLDSFLVLPFYHGGVLVGMAGIANRPEGYDEKMVEYLQPLLRVCSNFIESYRGVAQRKKAEDMIKESEERYRNLFDNAHEMIQSVAPDGHFIYVNPSWRKTLGYNQEDLQALTLFDIIHESCKTHCVNLFGKAISGEPIEFLESTFISKDGRLVEIEGNVSVSMVDGKVVATQCILRDVSERKKLQEQLSQISREWEETFNTITDMVTVHDKDFNIIRANKAAEKILGLPFLEVKKAKCFEYYHGTGCPPEGCPSCQSLVTGKPSTFELFEPHLNMHIEIRAIPRLDSNNQVVGLIHVVRDITERKKSEEALASYSRELTSLNTASNTLMLITNPEDIYKEICNNISSVFELRMIWLGLIEEGNYEVKPVAYAGHEDGYLSSIKVTWDDAPTSKGLTGTAIKTGKPVKIKINESAFALWKTEAQNRGYIEAVAVPLIYARDKCLGALNFYSDNADYFTSDRIKLFQIFANQAAIAIENARLVSGLEVEVGRRTRALEDTNMELQKVNKELYLRREEAEAASRSKSDFLANMSHELRTPLNAIMGFSEIMQTGMAGPVTDKQKEFLSDIYTSGDHLLTLITEILDLSKIEAGKTVLETETFILKELIEASLIMFKGKALKHAIKVTTEIDNDITEITADQRKLKQVMVNLLSNALKFTPDGGSVRVTARLISDFGFRISDSKETEDKSAIDGNLIEISVEDTGIGISEENQQRLFQPFQQIETSLTRKYAGTGLGLSLCRKFVELHGGRIWVESEPGKGSRFVFIIPVKQ